METFKVGDHVYSEEDFVSGEIVEINGDSALVEFRTPGGGGCLPFKLSELKHEKEEISRKKYVIFDRESYLWQMVYCNNHKPDEETLKDIAKSMVSLQYCGKFSSDGSVCMNGGGIKNDSNIFVMSENGVQYLWQLGSKVSDMEGFIVPHLYHVRKIGMIV